MQADVYRQRRPLANCDQLSASGYDVIQILRTHRTPLPSAHTQAYTHTHTYMHTRPNMSKYTRTHKKHAHTHTHTHINIPIQILKCRPLPHLSSLRKQSGNIITETFHISDVWIYKTLTDRQIDRQTDRHKPIQMDGQTNTDRRTDGWTDS